MTKRSDIPDSDLSNTFCPLCGGKERKFLGEDFEFPVWRCIQCSHVYISPLPSSSWLTNYYADTYMPDTNNEWEDWRNDVYDKSLRAITRLHPERGELLEVGTGFGGFLIKAGEYGWSLHGIEPHHSAFAIAQERLAGKASLQQATFQESEFASSSFDCIVMLNLIEHVSDPLEICKKAFELLRPGGSLVLRWPHTIIFNLSMTGLFMKPTHSTKANFRIGAPWHLHEFTSKSMKTMLYSIGFESISYFWPGSQAYPGRSLTWRAVIRIIRIMSRICYMLTLGKLPAPIAARLTITRKPLLST